MAITEGFRSLSRIGLDKAAIRVRQISPPKGFGDLPDEFAFLRPIFDRRRIQYRGPDDWILDEHPY
jgi:hypothetical protein